MSGIDDFGSESLDSLNQGFRPYFKSRGFDEVQSAMSGTGDDLSCFEEGGFLTSLLKKDSSQGVRYEEKTPTSLTMMVEQNYFHVSGKLDSDFKSSQDLP